MNSEKKCCHCGTVKLSDEFMPLVRGKYLQSRCRPCRRLLVKDPTKKHASRKRYWAKLRQDVLMAYSHLEVPACRCCNETIEAFLTLDHINEDGAEHRKRLGGRNQTKMVYREVRSLGYPGGFQVLCFNCNCAKHRYGTCPHQFSDAHVVPA